MTNKKIIVVLGMHRSGTSTITRALEVLGVSLGNNLMPAIAGNNDKGFFEDVDINELNIDMLNFIGSDWDCLASIENNEILQLNKNGYFIEAVELLRRKTSKVTTFGFKDPRIAKLLPFWMPVFEHCGFEVNFILACRNPLSVVKSLSKRDGIPAEKGYLLWLGHTLFSLFYTQKSKRIILDYDHLIEHSQKDIQLIADKFNLKLNFNELNTFQSEFVDLDLRHTLYTVNDLAIDQSCPPLVIDIYSRLVEHSKSNEPTLFKELNETTNRWMVEFGRLKSTLKLADSLSAKISNLNQKAKTDEIDITEIILILLKQNLYVFKKYFNPIWYQQKYPDIDNPSIDPYEHYIHFGVYEGRTPSENLIDFINNALQDRLIELNNQINIDKTSRSISKK